MSIFISVVRCGHGPMARRGDSLVLPTARLSLFLEAVQYLHSFLELGGRTITRKMPPGYLQAVGADLEIRAVFPDGRTVRITQIAE